MAHPAPRPPQTGSFLRPDNAVRKRLPRSAWIVIVVLAIVVAGGSLLGDRGLSSYLKLREERRNLQNDVQQLRDREQGLAEDLRSLKTDLSTLERVARDKYGMAYEGETIIHVAEDANSSTGEADENHPQSP